MARKRLACIAAATGFLVACEGLTVDVGVGLPPHFPPPQEPHGGPPAHDPYPDLPRRASYCAMNDVDLFEGVYVGDFVLGRSQIEVRGAGAAFQHRGKGVKDRVVVNLVDSRCRAVGGR